MRTRLSFPSFLIPFYLIFFGLVSSQCQINQKSTLIKLKNKLHFNSSISTKLVSWNPNTIDCCTWGGVTCSISGQVIGLDLSNELISGALDENNALFDLKFLEVLNLAGNNFNVTQIPSKFGSFASLKYLNLSNLGFSGQIPGELSQLTRLETLDLSSFFPSETNSLSLDNPNLATLVQTLTKLRGLYLDNVNISSQSSDWGQSLSSSLPNLEVLSLKNCQLSGPFDDSLQKLKSLSEVHLAENNLSAPVPKFFASFKNLTVLILGTCNLVGTFPNEILQSKSLRILDLSFNENLYGSLPDFPTNGSLKSVVIIITNFSGGIPDSIGNLKHLSNLVLFRNNFSGPIPKSIQNLSQLRYIHLSSNNFIGQIPSFQMCVNLKQVDLSENNLSGTIPSTHFQDLENLVSLDLGFNGFKGSLPSSLFSLQKLRSIDLSNNNFEGLLANFINPLLSPLDTLDLSSNKLKGEIPRSIFTLRKLNYLMLSSNNLSGTIRIEDFQESITALDLSFNNLLNIISDNITISNHLPNLSILRLASCNLLKFPNLRNQTSLDTLDLSNNKIEGKIPSWIWEVGNGKLSYVNLSHNRLTSLEKPYSFPDLDVLDLHSNHLSGVIPVLPRYALHIDYSHNHFNSSLAECLGRDPTYAFYFSASNNLLNGVIPKTICKYVFLTILDFSNNRLNGSIPRCLIESGGYLGALNLGNNSLGGRIEGIFPNDCKLSTLDLHGNQLEGKIPKSLVNCTMLEVFNLGKNKINDTYPCHLSKNANLRVLVLRSNMLHGSMVCGHNQHNKWPKLQIVDIAHNSFSGTLPPDFFQECGAMMVVDNKESKKHLSFVFGSLYYQDSVSVIIKGLELELVKILTLFTSIDISSNRFSGEIPNTIGQLKALFLLNISHNEFTGSIPTSIGNLSQLESLDMSSNRLTGIIPAMLTSIHFLSSFNLSYNQLEGQIPIGNQFQTFENNSYIGNNKLCGFPLSKACTNSVLPVQNNAPILHESDDGKDWKSIFYGMGVGSGSLVVISVLYILWKEYFSSAIGQRNLSS